jgi:hypothetical protein
MKKNILKTNMKKINEEEKVSTKRWFVQNFFAIMGILVVLIDSNLNNET